MFAKIEDSILPENREAIGRVFVTDGLEHARVCYLASRIMDIYAEVTGKQFSESDRSDYPGYIVERFANRQRFELRFGMPKLAYPASEHGKLWGRGKWLITPTEQLHAVGFWVDTNDGDSRHPSPESSQLLEASFNGAIQELADKEFDDISVPAPMLEVIGSYYNPTVTPWIK